MDEYVRTTDRLARVDDFMGQMFRGDGEREPLISDMAPRRCEISMTRPTKTPGVSSDKYPSLTCLFSTPLIVIHAEWH